MLKTKLSILFISAIVILASCSSVKVASKEVIDDPIYTSKAEIKRAIRMEKVKANRMALENGAAAKQGKKSGNVNGKYDYMPATSYGQRFNRTGNSFFLSSRASNSYYNNQMGFGPGGGMMSMGAGGMYMGGMYNPGGNTNCGCNYANSRFGDPFSSYSNMQSSFYPFFTYNPYMYSYSLLNNSYDPWMMRSSFSNPYFYNPYYSYNPYNRFGNANGYCPYTSSYRTASSPNKNYVSQRRNSNIGTSSSSNESGGRTSSGGNTNTTSYGSSNKGSGNKTSGTTFGNSGSGTSRGGYNSGSRAGRSTSGSKGSKRR